MDLEESKYVVKEKKMPNTDKEIFFVRNVFWEKYRIFISLVLESSIPQNIRKNLFGKI